MSNRIIRFGTVTEPSNDKGPHKLVRGVADGKPLDFKAWETDGVESNPVKGSDVLILTPDGDDGKAVGLIMPPAKDRTDGQAEGEKTYKNHKTGNEIRHDKDGGTVKLHKSGDIGVLPKGGNNVFLGSLDAAGTSPVMTEAGPSRNVRAKV
jgi:hypothetical protein